MQTAVKLKHSASAEDKDCLTSLSERLRVKCEEYGVTLLRVNEAYTSKTNSFNGEVFNIGSRSSFVYDGVTVDRDINGARNILLRAMRDSSFQG